MSDERRTLLAGMLVAFLTSLACLSLFERTIAQPPSGPTILEGNVEIRGNLTVSGSIKVTGRLTAYDLRTSSGLIRWGDDDTATSLDQTIYLQKRCGSRDEQSALVQQPASATNGALFMQVPGDRIFHSSIAAQILQYGPLKSGNPRRQRFSPGTVYIQSDGNAFADLSSTLSGSGDAQGLAPLPVLLDYDAVTPARFDAAGFRILIPPPAPAPAK